MSQIRLSQNVTMRHNTPMNPENCTLSKFLYFYLAQHQLLYGNLLWNCLT